MLRTLHGKDQHNLNLVSLLNVDHFFYYRSPTVNFVKADIASLVGVNNIPHSSLVGKITNS